MSSATQQTENRSKKTKNGKSFVAAMRRWATQTKTNKEQIAEKAVSKISLLQKPVLMYVVSARMLAEVTHHGARIFGELLTREELRQRLETLIANAVQDSANRVNEAANIIEAMSKSEDIQSAFVSIKDAVKDFDETMSGLVRDDIEGHLDMVVH